MPTATLTWSENHGDSNPQSTFALTTLGAIQLLNQYFTALAAFSDFPWEVCSHQATAPAYVTLKRKTGAAGRIVFIGVTSAPNLTYNPQLGNLSWNAAGIRAAWFPAATSDTPANILATSGDVFTNPANSTGLGPNLNAFTTGTYTFTAWACEDGVFMRYGDPAAATKYWAIGDLMEDASGTQAGITFSSTAFFSGVPNVNPAISDSGGFRIDGANTLHFNTGWSLAAVVGTYMRDSGAKKAVFFPISLACLELPMADMATYKFRQIALGPTPLGGYERLEVNGPVLKAQSAYPVASSGFPWLTNFKV